MKNIESHMATIIIENNGLSKILIKPGADEYLDINLIDKNIKLIEMSYIIILQLETPLDTVEYTINKCHEKQKIVILKPSPGIKLSENIIQKVNYLIPNESELEIISGKPTYDKEQIELACKTIMNKGAQNLIVTLGNKGCILWNKDGKKEYCSYPVDKVVDSTGADDCFIGVFAAYLSKKATLDDAIKYANLAASISVSSVGTMNSLPKLEAINKKREKITNW